MALFSLDKYPLGYTHMLFYDLLTAMSWYKGGHYNVKMLKRELRILKRILLSELFGDQAPPIKHLDLNLFI